MPCYREGAEGGGEALHECNHNEDADESTCIKVGKVVNSVRVVRAGRIMGARRVMRVADTRTETAFQCLLGAWPAVPPSVRSHQRRLCNNSAIEAHIYMTS
jgi:hypothetical protein